MCTCKMGEENWLHTDNLLRPNFLEVLKMLPFIHVLEVKIYLELKHHGSFAVVQLVIYG